MRLYSIASSRYGDNFDGMTTTLCVRRATYWDPEMGKDDPAKKGICSNFLCDAEPGTEVVMTGEWGSCWHVLPVACSCSWHGLLDVVCCLYANCVHEDKTQQKRRAPAASIQPYLVSLLC